MSQPQPQREPAARNGRERAGDLADRLLTAQEAERTRIARDLHDGVCQDVAAISVDLSYLRQHGRGMTAEDLETALLSIERRAAVIVETLRRMSHGLHPAVLQHVGLVAALQSHCAEIERQYRVGVRFFAEGAIEPIDGRMALSLFRLAQEALHNAARHAQARHVTVSLTRRDGILALRVADDGRGFDVMAARKRGGLGLVSIEERVRLANGRIEIRSGRQGTAIDVFLPISVSPDDAVLEEPIDAQGENARENTSEKPVEE